MTSASNWEPVRRIRTHEQVLAQIEAKIIDGQLRPGEKLPSERELVEVLGVSRNSVREALRSLEALGIIDSHTGSGRDAGSTVTGRSTAALSNLLRLHVALAQISLADLVEIRVQLERNAASSAALHASAADLDRLQGLIDSMRAADLPYEQFNELDTEFHVTIARSSQNALSADLMQALRDAVKSEMTAVFDGLSDRRAVASALVTEHQRIVDAIKAGDGTLAADLVAGHITNFYNEQLRERDTT